jgi:hypothetical protein
VDEEEREVRGMLSSEEGGSKLRADDGDSIGCHTDFNLPYLPTAQPSPSLPSCWYWRILNKNSPLVQSVPLEPLLLVIHHASPAVSFICHRTLSTLRIEVNTRLLDVKTEHEAHCSSAPRSRHSAYNNYRPDAIPIVSCPAILA